MFGFILVYCVTYYNVILYNIKVNFLTSEVSLAIDTWK